MKNLQFQYPTYYLIFCVLAGLLLAALLYYKSDFFRDQSKKLNILLGGLRFLGVSLIGFLLLSPIIKSLFTETKAPIVVIAQDNSESLKVHMSEAELSTYNNQITQLSEELMTKYDVRVMSFGEEIKDVDDFDFGDKTTNISDAFAHIYDNYSDQNLGAVILASDGIFNEGSSPIYGSTQLDAPVYTIALGDTTAKRDLRIRKVFHNQIAYLGDQFNIEVDVSAYNCTAQRTILRINKYTNGKYVKIKEESILINSNDFFTTKTIILDAEAPGVSRYQVTLTAVKDEATLANNAQEIFVDILDARQKIAILANAPHPDLTAIKTALETNKNYEIEIKYAKDPSINWPDYDLAILHQLPSKKYPITNTLAQLEQRKIATWHIVGLQSDLNAVSRAQAQVDITGDGRNTNDVYAGLNANFNLFTLDNGLANAIPAFAPLTAPFGEYIADATSQVLLYQRIGKVDTKYPLLIFGENNGSKIAVLTAEGIWKWKLYDFLQHDSHDLFNEMIRKTAQYLTVKDDKRRFQINIPKKIFKENEQLSMDAILYNQSYELINDPEVNLSIRDSDNKDYNYIFSKKDKAYNLDAGFFPIGNYTYTGKTNHAGQALEYKGQFSVQPIHKELFESTANHGLLAQLSNQFGGEMIYQKDINTLAGKIEASGNVKPVLYQSSETKSIINFKWLFGLLFAILGIEWFARRYFGSY